MEFDTSVRGFLRRNPIYIFFVLVVFLAGWWIFYQPFVYGSDYRLHVMEDEIGAVFEQHGYDVSWVDTHHLVVVAETLLEGLEALQEHAEASTVPISQAELEFTSVFSEVELVHFVVIGSSDVNIFLERPIVAPLDSLEKGTKLHTDVGGKRFLILEDVRVSATQGAEMKDILGAAVVGLFPQFSELQRVDEIARAKERELAEGSIYISVLALLEAFTLTSLAVTFYPGAVRVVVVAKKTIPRLPAAFQDFVSGIVPFATVIVAQGSRAVLQAIPKRAELVVVANDNGREKHKREGSPRDPVKPEKSDESELEKTSGDILAEVASLLGEEDPEEFQSYHGELDGLLASGESEVRLRRKATYLLEAVREAIGSRQMVLESVTDHSSIVIGDRVERDDDGKSVVADIIVVRVHPSQLPKTIKRRALVRALEREGWVRNRRKRGGSTHRRYEKGGRSLVIVYHHSRPYSGVLLSSDLTRAGFTREEVVELVAAIR